MSGKLTVVGFGPGSKGDMTLRAVQQIVSMRKKKTFTLLISVDGSLLTQNVRNLLTGMMTEYRNE